MALNYDIFKEAWQVIWQVKILSGDGYDPMNVYGWVTMSYWYAGGKYETKLFSRSWDNNAVVYVGGNVPLSRRAMAVPLGVDLTLDLNLWDYIRVFSDRCIARWQHTWHIGGQSPVAGMLADQSSSCVQVCGKWTRVSQTDD